MNKLYTTRGGEHAYSAPSVEMLDVTVEKGFAESSGFGEPGAAGDYIEPGKDYEF